MKKTRLLALLLVLMLSLTVFIGCGGGDTDGEDNTDGGNEGGGEEVQSIEWKLGHLGNDTHIWNVTALKFAELVSEKTDGQITVTVYPNESLGNEIDTINMIQSGAADMVISGESMQNWAPTAAMMAVPYAFNGEAHMRSVVEGDIGREIEDEITEKVGLVPLYYHVRAPRNLTSNKPISTPADLAGFKMRVPNVPLFVEAWKAAGASPQVMAFSEVFTALQQNVIHGQENPYDLIHSANFNEVQEYVNETEHVYGWIYVLVGEAQFNELTEANKAAVREAAAEAQEFGDGLLEEEIARYKQELQDRGMKINSDVDKAAFQEAMAPAVQEFLDEAQLDIYNRIVEAGK
ncbi:TRAP transporter substrate-binding protein [Alkalibacter rhizosphaerae]|uniref:TRAP transporter substrate-binding protein n=1 Tax=Alkalibacter rhizosphaerae TaxID=2815577 RepID=A0A974XIW2_9FIRM|nr:TRAP transporter substrate-binding protein [Alkalibacter rhizosphaerae]QSX09198.1 TRAP transporter substrate-binding protein [Alkalibacter rhizosphaerae]